MAETYKIVRFYQDAQKPKRTIKTGLSLAEAQQHCDDPETSSTTAVSAAAKRETRLKGLWFDGYEKE